MGTVDTGNGRSYSKQWAGLSPEGLGDVIRRSARASAEADGSGLLVFLRDTVLEAYVRADYRTRLRQVPSLRAYLSFGDAERAAADDAQSPRTVQDWASRFRAFACAYFRAETDRGAAADSADVQCADICGRKRQEGRTVEPQERWNSRAKTRRVALFEGDMCGECPRRATGG